MYMLIFGRPDPPIEGVGVWVWAWGTQHNPPPPSQTHTPTHTLARSNSTQPTDPPIPAARAGIAMKARAYMEAPPMSVVLCANRLADRTEMEEALVHELVHVYDVRFVRF